jgi:hypothetical protein
MTNKEAKDWVLAGNRLTLPPTTPPRLVLFFYFLFFINAKKETNEQRN